MCHQHNQRNEGKDKHGLHPRGIRILPGLVNNDSRQFTPINREHRNGVEREDKRHTESVGRFDTELRVQIRRNPEEEEPPHAIGHELAECESPRLSVHKAADKRTFLFRCICRQTVRIFIRKNIVELGLIDTCVLLRFFIHKDPESHPYESQCSNDDKSHFPAEGFGQRRDG